MSSSRGGRPWRRLVAYVIARDLGICWICHHPGADSGGHVLPVLTHPQLRMDPRNVKAEHLTERTKRVHGYDCPGNINRGTKPPPTNARSSRQW